MDLEALQSLLQTPRMQWYLRYGAQARRVARSCEHAGWYLHGALTLRQGHGIVEDLGSLSFTVKYLFDDDELTPALKAFVAAAAPGEGEGAAALHPPPASGELLTEEIRTLFDLAQQAVEAADSIPGYLKRYVHTTEQVSLLVRALWAFGRSTEHLCASCEKALAESLKNS